MGDIEERRCRPYKGWIDDATHFLQKSRIAPLAFGVFTCYMSLRLHNLLTTNYANMRVEIVAAFIAHAGVQIATIKYILEHIAKPIERDHD